MPRKPDVNGNDDGRRNNDDDGDGNNNQRGRKKRGRGGGGGGKVRCGASGRKFAEVDCGGNRMKWREEAFDDQWSYNNNKSV